MNVIVCPKCNKLNAQATGAPDEACPYCGVIYAKARQPSAEPPRMRAKVAQAVGASDGGRFIDQLRAKSHYPAFRALVGLFYLVGLALGLIALVLGIVVAWNGSLGAGIGGAVAGLIVLILAKVGKEVSLMVADMSDATIHMAARVAD